VGAPDNPLPGAGGLNTLAELALLQISG